jgi:hypothetical protein
MVDNFITLSNKLMIGNLGNLSYATVTIEEGVGCILNRISLTRVG